MVYAIIDLVKKIIEISDEEEEEVEKEKKKKQRFNQKLFEKSCALLDKEKAKNKEKPKNQVDPSFAAELERIKEGFRLKFFWL